MVYSWFIHIIPSHQLALNLTGGVLTDGVASKGAASRTAGSMLMGEGAFQGVWFVWLNPEESPAKERVIGNSQQAWLFFGGGRFR